MGLGKTILSSTSYSLTRGNYGRDLLPPEGASCWARDSVSALAHRNKIARGAKRIDVSPFVQHLCQLWWCGTKSRWPCGRIRKFEPSGMERAPSSSTSSKCQRAPRPWSKRPGRPATGEAEKTGKHLKNKKQQKMQKQTGGA